MKYTSFLVLIAVIFISCQGKDKPQNNLSKEELDELLIESYKKSIETEDDMIDAYVEEKGWSDMNKSNTGLRFWIYENVDGENCIKEDYAYISYSINLLNDSVVYNSDELVQIFIDMDESPSGLHEGLKLMSKGDKAKFILPSFLAYGLSGDQINIPMNSSIVLDVHLQQHKMIAAR